MQNPVVLTVIYWSYSKASCLKDLRENVQSNKQTKQTNKQTNKKQTDKQTKKHINAKNKTNERTNERTNKQTNKQTSELDGGWATQLKQKHLHQNVWSSCPIRSGFNLANLSRTTALAKSIGSNRPILIGWLGTLPKFNSEFSPEKLPGPILGSRIVGTNHPFFRAFAVKNFGCGCGKGQS